MSSSWMLPRRLRGRGAPITNWPATPQQADKITSSSWHVHVWQRMSAQACTCTCTCACAGTHAHAQWPINPSGRPMQQQVSCARVLACSTSAVQCTTMAGYERRGGQARLMTRMHARTSRSEGCTCGAVRAAALVSPQPHAAQRSATSYDHMIMTVTGHSQFPDDDDDHDGGSAMHTAAPWKRHACSKQAEAARAIAATHATRPLTRLFSQCATRRLRASKIRGTGRPSPSSPLDEHSVWAALWRVDGSAGIWGEGRAHACSH